MFEQITTHTKRALDLLVQHLREQPDVAGFLVPLLDQVQDAEDVVWGLIAGQSLATATGAQLDQLGEDIGVKRDGRTDAEYRSIIQIKRTILLAQGDPELVIAAVKFFSDGTTVQLTEPYPAFVRIVFDGAVFITTTEFARNIKATIPAGVALELIQRQNTATGDKSFTFLGNPAPNIGGFGGYADGGDPTTGGAFVSLLKP